MIKINTLEIENTKRVKAVKIEPTYNGLTIVGGRNGQGKTSVLDSIAWCLGGDRFRPSTAQRADSLVPPSLRIKMSNGLLVERNGKNSDLKVTDPNGVKGGQQLLNEFVDELAINLPKFMGSSSKEKAKTLLQIVGVGEQIYELENLEKELYSKRTMIGNIADQKKKFAREMPDYLDVPKDLVSPSELLKQQQDILLLNGENRRKRENLENIKNKVDTLTSQILLLETELKTALSDLETANTTAENLQDEATAKLEDNILNIELLNQKIRANLDKEKAQEDFKGYEKQYQILTDEIENIRKNKFDLLKGADLPLEELSVEDGELVYKGFKWDSMSGADQFKVSTAIIRKINPNCGFVLIDKLEQMDVETLHEFGLWLESEGLQAIATRVSTGEECSIIIEDGYVKETEEKTNWKEGVF